MMKNMTNLEPIWFILIDRKKEGPYNLFDLKHHKLFTLDTLVWREGFPEWVSARCVPELAALFKKEEHPFLLGDQQSVLTMEKDPFQRFFWFILVLLIAVYLIYFF